MKHYRTGDKHAYKMHYRGARDGYAFCGACVPTSQLTAHRSSITCKLCLRHMLGASRRDDLATAAMRKVLFPNDGTRLDTLMRNAFKDYEGGLAVRVAALKLALQGWEDADRDDLASAGEGMRTEAQALINYLEGK